MKRPKRLTPDELEKLAQQNREIEAEYVELNNYTLAFHRQWAELDNALGALLYEILHLPDSHIAYAIYFSPTSAEARAEIVSNALLQLVRENDDLGKPRTNWKKLNLHWVAISETLSAIRNFRNKVAHGSAQRLVIGKKTHLRLMSPAFDVIRVGRTIDRKQVPGLTAHDIQTAVSKTRFAVTMVDFTNKAIVALRDNDTLALLGIFSELEANLKALRSL
jgi:hypothetical protein